VFNALTSVVWQFSDDDDVISLLLFNLSKHHCSYIHLTKNPQ